MRVSTSAYLCKCANLCLQLELGRRVRQRGTHRQTETTLGGLTEVEKTWSIRRSFFTQRLTRQNGFFSREPRSRGRRAAEPLPPTRALATVANFGDVMLLLRVSSRAFRCFGQIAHHARIPLGSASVVVRGFVDLATFRHPIKSARPSEGVGKVISVQTVALNTQKKALSQVRRAQKHSPTLLSSNELDHEAYGVREARASRRGSFPTQIAISTADHAHRECKGS